MKYSTLSFRHSARATRTGKKSSVMRLMLDTCVIIDLLVDVDNLSKGALDMLGDPENVLFASCESMREL